MIQTKPNPYVKQLMDEIDIFMDRDGAKWSTTDDVLATLARFTAEKLAAKNQRIHEIDGKLQHLHAEIARLGKVLERHNAGVRKDGESPIACAIRMLSPVRDDTPKRDRP